MTLRAEELVYSYGERRAVNGVSFHINAGEVYGLLGPNGAGKTTLINMLASLLVPQSGRILFNGADVTGRPALIRPKLGVVPQEISLYDELTARENLHFFGGLYGIEPRRLREQAQRCLELVGLAPEADRQLSGYSGGMKRRINIAASLLHEPALILMDEPTVGVDPQSRNHIFELIEQLRDGGTSVLYTTHYMEEAQRLCSRIGIVDHGELIGEGSLDELLARLPQRDLIRLSLEGATEQELQELATQPLAPWQARLQGGNIVLQVANAGRSLAEITTALGAAAARITELKVERANLESVFLQLTGRSLRD